MEEENVGSYISLEDLEPTPSRLEGVPKETEDELRVFACEFIHKAAVLLRLPQVCSASAQVSKS
jgi:hypothetical protein